MSESDARPAATVPEIEKALGKLVIAFSEMELRIHHLIWALLDDAEAGQILTSAMSFKRAAVAAEQLLRSRVPERTARRSQDEEIMAEVRRRAPSATDPVDYVFRSVRSAEDERNRLLHSWWPDPSEPHWRNHVPVTPSGDPNVAPTLGEAAIRWKAERKTGRLHRYEVPLDELDMTVGKFMEIAKSLAWMAGVAMGQAQSSEAPNAPPDTK